MLYRTSTIRHRDSGVPLKTPLLIPSFSSKGFAKSKKDGKSDVTPFSWTVYGLGFRQFS